MQVPHILSLRRAGGRTSGVEESLVRGRKWEAMVCLDEIVFLFE